MSIGSTIKKLRRQRNITQEQLAEWLGISTNAVSQWECEKTAPDISHLPMLANIFEVSADILLEIDITKSKKQEEIEEFKAKHQELHSQGKTAERLALCREMQKKYPNDETVRSYLMRVLQNGYANESFDEIVMLGEQLLDSTEHRIEAIHNLFFTYLRKGDRKTALKYADMMPPSEDLYISALEGDALVEHCQNYFWKVCDHMYLYMRNLLACKEAGYTYEEKHSMWKTLYDMFQMVFSNGDFGFYNERLARISFSMAMESGRVENFDRALEEMETMITHLEDFQGFTEIFHTSLLVNQVKIHINQTSRSKEETLAQSYLRYLNQYDAVFASVKNDSRFENIKKRLATL
ncbi:MAG: helix-turn-helix transcriptional regulator [Clostridia bacterium]|nr:helix-turn-helix transcriptional regulator [Clostridia bacterium]